MVSVLSFGQPFFGAFKANLTFAADEDGAPSSHLQFFNTENILHVGYNVVFLLFGHSLLVVFLN